ncbi:MAG: hypothetical protein JW734_08965 [Candidatus Omnitrophica bacterium]|nr:hypothetical protein [Candidatus Omnitrophota bacterium]
MLTIFTIPKPFLGRLETIQRNALKSWCLLKGGCEIVLFGDDEGVSEAAADFGVLNIPGINRNSTGTPFLDSVFTKVEGLARNSILAYINADIILMDDFLSAIKDVSKTMREFLLVGHRWDLKIDGAIDFSQGWQEQLRLKARHSGSLHSHAGIDYFVFPRGLVQNFPPFLVGRPGWDSWFIYHIRSKGIPVVDITKLSMVVHHNHDYSHHAQGRYGVWQGEEARYNLELAGGYHNLYTLKDATHILTKKGLLLNKSLYRFYRRLVAKSVTSPFYMLLYKLWRRFSDLVRA